MVEQSTVPVIETGTGNCHVYVDQRADIDTALAILVNAKAQRPSVCNAAETVLVHAGIADAFLPRALEALAEAGVDGARRHRLATAAGGCAHTVLPATDEDWASEYLSTRHRCGGRALAGRRHRAHPRSVLGAHRGDRHGRHRRGPPLQRAVDSAAVMVNASTRFTDGAEFGFGAEIGISTQKLHARGPMGLPELTSTKYVVTGDGQVRA